MTAAMVGGGVVEVVRVSARPQRGEHVRGQFPAVSAHVRPLLERTCRWGSTRTNSRISPGETLNPNFRVLPS
eukprot:3745334-Pyramimonas_sp.AAC.1